MAENIKRDEAKQRIASLPWLIYSDFYWAKVSAINQDRDINGKDVWKITIIPTDELAARYKIQSDMTNENMEIEVTYPIDMVEMVNNDPTLPCYFCYLNFNAQETEFVRKLKGFIEIKKIQGMRDMMNLLKAENAFWREQAEVAKTNVLQYIRDNIQGPASELSMQLQAQRLGQNTTTSATRGNEGT